MTRRCIDDTDREIVRVVAELQPATIRQVATEVGLSVAVVHHRVLMLAMRQLLEREPRRPRTIRLHPSVVVIPGRGVHQMEKMT